MDPRIRTKAYGRKFVDALRAAWPDLTIVGEEEDDATAAYTPMSDGSQPLRRDLLSFPESAPPESELPADASAMSASRPAERTATCGCPSAVSVCA